MVQSKNLFGTISAFKSVSPDNTHICGKTNFP